VPGDGDEGELDRLAGVAQTPIDRGKVRMVVSCGEGGDVERVTNPLAAALDGPSAALGAAVAVERRQADQSCHRLGRTLAEFGQQGEQRRGGDRPDARRRDPQATVGMQVGRFGDRGVDLDLQGTDPEVILAPE